MGGAECINLLKNSSYIRLQCNTYSVLTETSWFVALIALCHPPDTYNGPKKIKISCLLVVVESHF